MNKTNQGNWTLFDSCPQFASSSLTILISFLLLSSSALANTRYSHSKDFASLERLLENITQLPDFTSQKIAQADSSQDPQRTAAQQLFNEGMELYRKGTAESLREAIVKWKEALSLYNIAFAERDRGNLQESLIQIETALKIIRDLRTQFISPELRTSYFATVHNYYQLYIDLLMQLHQQDPSKGYDGQALYASESSRARSLVELLTESNTNIRQGVDPQLRQQEQTLQNQLDAIEKRRVELYSSSQNPTDEQKTSLEQNRITLLQKFQEIQNQIRANSPKYAALKYPKPLNLKQIQQQILDKDTLLLQYSLGTERSYLWAVTQDNLTSYELQPRQEIEAQIQKFRGAVTNTRTPSQNRLLLASASLSKILLSPVAEQLDKKRLLIVGDGALQYVPFSALSSPNISPREYQPLIAEYEIVNLPSASALDILRQKGKNRKPAPKQLAILADPIFTADDERVKGEKTTSFPSQVWQLGDGEESWGQYNANRSARQLDIQLGRLPYTRTEADAIMALIPESERTHAFEFEANREFATNPQLSQY